MEECLFMKISRDLLSTDHDKVIRYLEDSYNDLIQKYMKQNSSSNKDIPNIIWVCWWQGLENAPEIVKVCFESIKKFAGERKVPIRKPTIRFICKQSQGLRKMHLTKRVRF